MKKILLVSNGFYPEISPRSYRATELAKEFCRQGHDVTVISKFRDHDYKDFLREFPLTFMMWGKQVLPSVPEFKKKYYNFVGRIISRLLSVLFEYPAIEDMFKVRRILKNTDGFDLMISFAVPYPVHWGVALARSARNQIARTWVADCGDPYMGDVLDSFRKPFYFGYLEKWFCSKADFITIPVEGAIKGYYSEFHDKIRIIPQGFDFDIDEAEASTQGNDNPIFGYAGSFLPGARNPKPLMDFLAELTMQFRFIIFTNKPEFVNGYKKILDTKLEIREYIPREKLLNELRKMDFLINFDNNTSLNSPSKLIDYAITGKPVLNITREFRKTELLEFLKGNYNNRMKLPDPSDYHISIIAKKFLSLIPGHPNEV